MPSFIYPSYYACSFKFMKFSIFSNHSYTDTYDIIGKPTSKACQNYSCQTVHIFSLSIIRFFK